MKNHPFAVALLWVVAVVALVAVVAGRPRRQTVKPLRLEHNGVHAPFNLRDKKGRLLVYNFRTVEPGVLYRGSGFPVNAALKVGGVLRSAPAAFADGQVFNFMRAKRIRRIVSLEPPTQFYAEKSYFDLWSRRSGYAIEVVSRPVEGRLSYDRSAQGGLRAATWFIEMMRDRKQGDGAVYLHDYSGKDSVGVIAAAYEMWRNRGRASDADLWRQVMERYLVSNTVIARDREAARLAPRNDGCAVRGGPPLWVCPPLLETTHHDLQIIAQL